MRVGQGKETEDFKQKSKFDIPSPKDVADVMDSVRTDGLLTDKVSSVDSRPDITNRTPVDTIGTSWYNHSLYHGAVY